VVQRYVPICEKETDRAKVRDERRSRLCGNCRNACPQPSIAPLSKRSDMALDSGIYTIKNVKNHNWAVLLNADDRGEVVAGSHKDGEKVRSFAVQYKINSKV
jgi:hypothetical protein